MLVFGLLLLLLAAVLLVGFLAAGYEQVEFDGGFVALTLSTLTIYLLGALTLLLVVAGLALLRGAARRSNRRRREHKELSRRTAELEATQASSRSRDEEATEVRQPSEEGTHPADGR